MNNTEKSVRLFVDLVYVCLSMILLVIGAVVAFALAFWMLSLLIGILTGGL
jgi:threonine aldolase